mgnify:CR=1 FL=1
MAIVVKSKFVCEDIVDKDNNVIGQIKFNPDDSNIMKTLTEILCDLNNSINKLDNYKDLDLSQLNDNSSLEDFKNASDKIEKTKDIFAMEYNVINKSISGLKDIFGEECINCFTGGTMDIASLLPLIEFIAPYVKKSRNEKVDKYLLKNNDVME